MGGHFRDHVIGQLDWLVWLIRDDLDLELVEAGPNFQSVQGHVSPLRFSDWLISSNFENFREISTSSGQRSTGRSRCHDRIRPDLDRKWSIKTGSWKMTHLSNHRGQLGSMTVSWLDSKYASNSFPVSYFRFTQSWPWSWPGCFQFRLLHFRFQV